MLSDLEKWLHCIAIGETPKEAYSTVEQCNKLLKEMFDFSEDDTDETHDRDNTPGK